MQKAPTFRHTFSHFHLDITPIYLKIKEKKLMMMDSDRYVWYKLNEIDQLGVSTPVKTLIQELAINLRS
jgi:A/G-specific adenine glycosylase